MVRNNVRNNASTPSLIDSDDTRSTNTDFFGRAPSPAFLTIPSVKGKEKENFLTPSYVRSRNSHSPARGPISLAPPLFEQLWLEPNILKRLLCYLPCDEFCRVTRTSPGLRDIFRVQALKDVILSAYVSSYTVRPNLLRSERIKVSISDLEGLQTSALQIPLWVYPQCAIDMLSYTEKRQDPPRNLLTQQDDLLQFCQIHSRFVLLLRFQTHEWDFHYSDTGDDQILRRSKSYPNLKELIFPPMLAYSPERIDEPQFTTPNLSSLDRDAKFDVLGKKDPLDQDSPLHTPGPSVESSSSLRYSGILPYSDGSWRRDSWLPDRSSSRTFDSETTGHSKRLSLPFQLRRPVVPPPTPLKAPPSLDRCADYVFYMYSKKHTAKVSSDFFNDSGSAPRPLKNLDNLVYANERLLPPQRNRHSATISSSASSSVGSFRRGPPTPSKLSLHSLENAASRLHAPILRVFVPCSSLTEPGVIEKATDQIVSAGLWDYLRDGDAICNLGYVPQESNLVHGWLIYIHGELHPFFPPELPQAVDLWKLPSPLYLTHLLPPHHNFRFVFSMPSGLEAKFHHEWMDVVMPSPGTSGGFLRVWRYEWFATVNFGSKEVSRLNLGQGWVGKWVLEMEGTREGGVKLVKAVNEGTSLTWEVLMDKSSKRSLWLKCIDPETEPVFRPPITASSSSSGSRSKDKSLPSTPIKRTPPSPRQLLNGNPSQRPSTGGSPLQPAPSSQRTSITPSEQSLPTKQPRIPQTPPKDTISKRMSVQSRSPSDVSNNDPNLRRLSLPNAPLSQTSIPPSRSSKRLIKRPPPPAR